MIRLPCSVDFLLLDVDGGGGGLSEDMDRNEVSRKLSSSITGAFLLFLKKNKI